MLIMGIDPGLTRCGVAIVEVGRDRRVSLHHYDVVKTPSTDPLERRLLAVDTELRLLLAKFPVEAVAVERVFAQANVRTVMGTAQVSGLAIVAAASNGLPVATYTPTEVKAAVTGNGRAGKAEVTAMVQRLLKLPAPPKPADAADALAIAICHGWRGTALQRIAAAKVKH